MNKHFGNFWSWGGAGGTPLAVTQEDCLVHKALQYKSANITNFGLALLLEKDHTNEVYNLEMGFSHEYPLISNFIFSNIIIAQ